MKTMQGFAARCRRVTRTRRTGGSAVGTVGGAAVGGYIGNQVGKDKK
jgi:outer membrane lipoprotein SlyB